MPRRATVLSFVMLLASACEAEVTRSGDEVVLTMLPLTKALVVGVPGVVALIGLALALQRRTRRDGIVMMLAIVGVSSLIVPGILLDRVTITPTGIWQRTGFWFAPNVKGFDYVEVEDVRIETRTGKNLDNDIWILQLARGGRREVDPGDLWEHNSGFIIPLLEAHGVRFVQDD